MRRGGVAAAGVVLALGLVGGCTAGGTPVEPTADDGSAAPTAEVACEPRLAEVVVGEPQVSEDRQIREVVAIVVHDDGQEISELMSEPMDPVLEVDPQLEELREWLFVTVSAILADDEDHWFDRGGDVTDSIPVDQPAFEELGEYRLYTSARTLTLPFEVTCGDVSGRGTLTGYTQSGHGAMACDHEPTGEGSELAHELWRACPARSR